MKIVMLESLMVKESVITDLSKKLLSEGHEFLPCYKSLSKDEKLARAKNADILIVTNGMLDEDIIEQAPKLKLISVAFTGVDHIPAEKCAENKITVCNSQGYATIPTAELAVTLMLMATRNIVEAEKQNRNNGTKAGLVGYELSNKTIGIVGTGQIGCQTATLLKGFNPTLLGYDPYENETAKALGVTYTSLESLFEQSDFISLHLPLLDSTRGIVNEKLIGKMKETGILVNCARGPIVETKALVKALNENKLRGAGVDVYEIEPPLPVDHDIFGAKNLVTTPHIAFASVESMERRAKIVFDNVYSFMNGNPINVKSQLK